MLAIANALAARSAGMDRQTLRDWVIRYNADVIAGLADPWGDGRPQRLDSDEAALQRGHRAPVHGTRQGELSQVNDPLTPHMGDPASTADIQPAL
jgi:hypothetical protein